MFSKLASSLRGFEKINHHLDILSLRGYSSSHTERIRDQFTKQASPFANFYLHHEDEPIKAIINGLNLSRKLTETVIDVGCGPGIVAAAIAPFVRNIIGIDATPAMLEKANEVMNDKGIKNISFKEGYMENLPIESSSVDGVVTRYTFHHLLEPTIALKEMVRICKPGGRIVICDAAPAGNCQKHYNELEKIRDPSHTKALTVDELTELASKWLSDITILQMRSPCKVHDLINRAFPLNGEKGRLDLVDLFKQDVHINKYDMGTTCINGELYMSFPVAVISGYKK